MNSETFYMKVREMRKLQKQYFKSRNSLVLQKCKAVETEIDAEIQRVDGLKGITESPVKQNEIWNKI